MREERLKILKLLAAGKISIEEADALLEALGGGEGASTERGTPPHEFPHFDFDRFFGEKFDKIFADAFGARGSRPR